MTEVVLAATVGPLVLYWAYNIYLDVSKWARGEVEIEL